MLVLSNKIYTWSPQFAYAVGLLVADGSLSIDGRHIDLSSADKEQLENFSICLNKDLKVCTKYSSIGRICFRVQFSDVKLYQFLLNIGIFPHKSTTIGSVTVPRKYFFDFLRGHFDGDGTFYSYKDSRWKSSYMFYMCFVSASKEHIIWLRNELINRLNIKGSLTKSRSNSAFQLKYAKKESLVLIRKLYYNSDVVCLTRKYNKIKSVLSIHTNRYSARVL